MFDGTPVGALAVSPGPPGLDGERRRPARQLADAVATELELSAPAKEFEAHRLRFELAIDAAEIGSFDWDLVTGRLVWDDRLVQIFGYDRGTFDETIEAFSAAATPTTPTGRGGAADGHRHLRRVRRRVPRRPARG